MKFSIQQLIDNEIQKKQDEYIKKEQTTWHSSALGGCLCGAYLARLGNKPDQEIDSRTLRVFDMGNKIEDWIVNLIKEQEYQMKDNKTFKKYEISTQERVMNEENNISGRLDIRIEDLETNEKEIIEVKSKHSKSFWYMDKKGQGAQESHQFQLWSYLWMTGTERGRIVYASKDDLAILEYPVFLNNKSLEENVKNQLEILNKAWKLKIPPLPAPEGSWQVKYCSHHKQCLQQKEYLQEVPLFYKQEDIGELKVKKKIIKI